jgi:hypothetical protein
MYLFFGCDSIPVRDNTGVIAERNEVMEKARDQFYQCFNGSDINTIEFKFKLYRTEKVLFKRPIAKAYNVKTLEDEIKISIHGERKNKTQKCVKAVLKKLVFFAVYPSVEFMESHEYKMIFKKH